MITWVIQHPNRGVFTGYGFNKGGEWIPKFRWSIPLDKGVLHYSEQAAKEKLTEIAKQVSGCTLHQIDLEIKQPLCRSA